MPTSVRVAVAAAAAAAGTVGALITYSGNVTCRPSDAQLRWHSYEVGVMITFNLQTWCTPRGAGNASTQACQAGSGHGELFVPSWGAVQALDPPDLDTDAWLAAAASFGAQYAVLTVDHMTGFALWPTKAHPFSVASTAWRGGGGDVVADFLASSTKHSLAPGLFYSTHFNWYLGVSDYQVGWPRTYGGPPLTQAGYEDVVLSQLGELAAYSPGWTEVWFDGGVDTVATPRVGPAVRSLFPTSVCHSCYNFTQSGGGEADGLGLRWMGDEEGVMPLPSWGATRGDGSGPFGGYPEGPVYLPPSTDTVLAEHYWFWQPESEGHLRSTCALLSAYLTSVGRASNLILNLAPNTTGGVSAPDASAYAAFGDATACVFSAPFGEVGNVSVDGGGSGIVDVPWPRAVPGRGGAPGVAEWDLSVHLQEDMSVTGQRMGNFSLQACVGGWGGREGEGEGGSSCTGVWTDMLPGAPPSAVASVGHKRILRARFSAPSPAGAASVSALRFTLDSAYLWRPGGGGEPGGQEPALTLARLALFDWGGVEGRCGLLNCSLPLF